MCGINGAFAYRAEAAPVDAGQLIQMRDQMRRRGPDGEGLWVAEDRRVGFGHRRLAIIDLSELAAQPMATADRRYTVTFNGEIYNYRELRARLEGAGAQFRSHSDTEVLLEMYRQYGAEMVHHLRGMFAFAIWDAHEHTLFLARDRYGIKPLYYANVSGTLYFASHAKALIEAGIDRQLDSGGVTGFLLWGSVPEPFTLYANVRLLPAGSTMLVTASKGLEIHRYWSIEAALLEAKQVIAQVPVGRESQYVRDALMDSVCAHMVADVNVGGFLSAGLDSSTIVGLARHIVGRAIQTITLSFENFEGRELDELPLAGEVARFLGVEHRGLRLSMREVEEELPRFLDAMDQPTIDGMNTWLISKAAAGAGLKVALSGLGGDELLGGYPTFTEVPRLVRRVRAAHLPLWLAHAYRVTYAMGGRYTKHLDPKRAGIFELGGRANGAYQLCRGLFMPWELSEIIDTDLVREGLDRLAKTNGIGPEVESLEPFAQVIALESSRYMRNQLLRDTDWISMWHSLEIRVPLVDHELTRRVAGLVMNGRLGGAKAILRTVLEPPLPCHIANKEKTGFTVPLWRWLRKSPYLGAWKQCQALRRENVHDYQRLAYSILRREPALETHLRT